jgi:hypothetical protein
MTCSLQHSYKPSPKQTITQNALKMTLDSVNSGGGTQDGQSALHV